jgi:hypothetical protein
MSTYLYYARTYSYHLDLLPVDGPVRRDDVLSCIWRSRLGAGEVSRRLQVYRTSRYITVAVQRERQTIDGCDDKEVVDLPTGTTNNRWV